MLFQKAGDVRDAVERGMDRGVRLSTDDLVSHCLCESQAEPLVGCSGVYEQAQYRRSVG